MLHIGLLGEQTIRDDDEGVVRTRSSRALALVAFLVVNADVPQGRQRMAGLFWPDSTDAQALTNLRRELHHLRQVLGDRSGPVVTSAGLGWRDHPDVRVDARQFSVERRSALAATDDDGVLRHGLRALAEYRGELLPGHYDDWVLDARSELEQHCVELCDLVGAAQVRTGDLAGAIESARRRISIRPLEEVGYRTLMQLQADAGDRAAAVSTYHRCASVLERELGVAPHRTTQQALQRLLSHSEPAGTERIAVPSGAGRPVMTRGGLVGRVRELGVLGEKWAAAAAGAPALVVISGAPGVGKTRLVSELVALATQQGAVVASSRCFGTTGRLTLAPVADWLRHPAVRAARAHLEPVWGAEVDRLLPSGDVRVDRTVAPRAFEDAWQRHRFLEGLARALLGVGRPVLLTLDNIQWCDQETLAFLTFVLGLGPDVPVLVAATLRTDASADHREVTDWLLGMRSGGSLTELVLDPFDAAETARLAADVSGAPLGAEDVDLLQATTGGFPLYVVEAVRTMVDVGRTSLPLGDLTAVLANRLEQASDAAREVAELAAAVGADFTLDLLTEASDLPPDVVVQGVDELWRRRIIRELPDGYDFSHDMLRESAYGLISPPRRWLLHRRVAQALELLHPDDLDRVSAQLAAQYARGGRPDRAVTYYRRAADVASAVFAHAEAVRLHGEALSIIASMPDGPNRSALELAVLEATAAPMNACYGYASTQLQHVLERSVELAESLGRRGSLLTGLVALWTSRFVQGRTRECYRVASRALDLVDPDSVESGPVHFAVGGAALSLGHQEEAVHPLGLAVRLTNGAPSLTVGTRPDVHATAWVGHAHWLLGQDDQARASCLEAIRLARSIGNPFSLAVALAYGGITQQMRGDRVSLADTAAELGELCSRYSFAYYRDWALILRGWAADDVAGLGLARRGVDNLKADGSLARMPYWLALLADLTSRHGSPAAAGAVLDGAMATAHVHDDLWWLPEVMRMRAGYDDPSAAIARLHEAARLAREQGSVALVRRCEEDLAAFGAEAVPSRR